MLDQTISSTDSWQWPEEITTTMQERHVDRSPAVGSLPLKSTFCDKQFGMKEGSPKRSSRWGRPADSRERRVRSSPQHQFSTTSLSPSKKDMLHTTKAGVLTVSQLRRVHASRKSYDTTTLLPKRTKQQVVAVTKTPAAIPFKGLAVTNTKLDRPDPRLASGKPIYCHDSVVQDTPLVEKSLTRLAHVPRGSDYLKWLVPIVAKTSQYGATASQYGASTPAKVGSNQNLVEVEMSFVTPEPSRKEAIALTGSPSNPNAPPFNIEFSNKSPRTTKKRLEIPCFPNYTSDKLEDLLKTPQTAKTATSLTEASCMDNLSPAVNLAKLLLESHALCSMAFPTAHQQPSGSKRESKRSPYYYTPHTLTNSNECRVTPLISGSYDSPPPYLEQPFKIKHGSPSNEETQATLSTESVSQPIDSSRQLSLDDDRSCSSFGSGSFYSSSYTDSSCTEEEICESDISCTSSDDICMSEEELEEEDESYFLNESRFSNTSDFTSAADELNVLPVSLEKSGVPEHLKQFDPKDRPLKDQLNSLSERQRNIVALLRHHWDTDHRPMPVHLYLRFAQYCQFNLHNGRKLISGFDEKFLKLTASQLEPQLAKQMLFPIPGLKSIYGDDMFFIRPSLFNPHKMTTQAVKVILSYVMLTMAEKEEAATDGVACIVFMNDRTTQNFSMDYCWQFMKMLQSAAPTRVSLFLLVNPPTWFSMIWQITKRMLHPTFQQKVRMIPERVLFQYLAPGYLAFLPKGTSKGTLDASQLVEDFIEYRKYVEEKKSRPKDL